ncbi:27848_t:CDS:2, partial [Racocetra persica]
QNNNKSLDKLVQLEHIFEPKYIMDLGHRTLIHLEKLDDPDAVTSEYNIDLKKLLESVNQFLQEYYMNLYTKLSKLLWGLFALRAFRVFSIIAINFNTISDYL